VSEGFGFGGLMTAQKEMVSRGRKRRFLAIQDQQLTNSKRNTLSGGPRKAQELSGGWLGQVWGPAAPQLPPIAFVRLFRKSRWGESSIPETAWLWLKERQRLFIDFGQVPQFDEVNAAFPGFGFGNEGLRPRHKPRNFGLSQASGLPRFFEPRTKKPIFPNVGLGLQ
jgi:hypothetical protein